MIAINSHQGTHMNTLSENLNKLLRQGTVIDLRLNDAGKLWVKGYRRQFSPAEVQLIWSRRFEGQSNPGDLAILYGLKLPDGKTGVLVDGYGTASDAKIITFIRAVPPAETTEPEP